MTPSEQCKAAGLKSLAELSQISNTSTRTLINWRRDKPALFATVLAGAVVIKAANVQIEGQAAVGLSRSNAGLCSANNGGIEK
jgi:hypothetical protein